MGRLGANSGLVRFGPFEADLRSCELRSNGLKVKLEGQPFQVLALLLEQPGQLVTREELQKKLWPGETFIDFEQGINAAVRRLRQALDDCADTPRFVETLPRRGYRFIETVESHPPLLPLASEETEPSPVFLTEQTRPEKPSANSAIALLMTHQGRFILAGLATVVACLLVAFVSNSAGGRARLLGRPLPARMTSIVVLPLQNFTGDPQQEYFVDSMTDALITELGKESALRVISRTSAMAFKNAPQPLPQIARQLGADVVLEGAVARNGDRLRITARLMHASRERTLWAASYDREAGELSKIPEEIALAVADDVKVTLGDLRTLSFGPYF